MAKDILSGKTWLKNLDDNEVKAITDLSEQQVALIVKDINKTLDQATLESSATLWWDGTGRGAEVEETDEDFVERMLEIFGSLESTKDVIAEIVEEEMDKLLSD